MGAVFLIFGSLVAILCLALAVLLLTPLHVRLAAEFGDRVSLRAEFRTLWGRSPGVIIRRDGATSDDARPVRKVPTLKRKEPSGRGRRKGRSFGGKSAFEMARAVLGFVSQELNRIRFVYVKLRADFGTGDPAETGEIYGLVQAIRPVVSNSADLELTPDFTRRHLSGSAEAALSFVPGSLVVPAVALAWKLWGPGR